MPPIVRETEVPAAGSATPTVRPVATSARPEDTPSRPLPVALEVAVTVNGARTVDGSDKREPFSESTKTVLVFGNGAVLRLSSAVAPGQLLFVTNEKTKKEVVCQVVKSKNYRNVSGYVELEFTEPIIGFWGMRFPNDRIGPPPSTRAPVPAAPAAEPPALLKAMTPVTSIVPGALQPAEAKPLVTAQQVPLPAAARTESQLPVASVNVAPLTLVAVAPVVEKSAELTVPDVGAPSIEKFGVQAEPQAQVTAPAAPANIEIPVSSVLAETWEQAVSAPQENEAVSAELVESLSPAASVLDVLRDSEAKAITPPAPKKETIPLAIDSSTEALKLETARLQEQLSALLFTEKAAAQPVQPAPVPVVDHAAVPDAATKLLELAKVELVPTPVKENKPAIPLRPVIKSTLEVEEVKIPAWLEPLARNDTVSSVTPETTAKEKAKHFEEARELEEHSEAAESAAKAASASASQGPRFGNQLPLDEQKSSAERASGGAKRGVLIAALAAGILAATAGGTWYLRQSSNPTSGTFAAVSQASGVPSGPVQLAKLAPVQATPPAHNISSAPATSTLVVSEQPVAASHEAAKPAANTSAPVTAAREVQPASAQPKKPILGDVHLATPVVHRNRAAQAGGEAAPNLDALQAMDNGDALGSGLAAGSSTPPAVPAAPLPVGGDVQPAKIIASVPPVYPALAKSQHVSGDVKIDALIDVSGRVTTMKILSGPPLLQEAAMDALRQWKYQPATLDGKPVPMHLSVTLRFRSQ